MAKRILGPGVFIEEIVNPALVGSASPAALNVAIVAAGPLTFTVANAQITRGATANTADTIVDASGNSVSASDIVSITSVQDIPDVPKYAAGTDYLLTGNTIDWSPAGVEPEPGAIYFVTFVKNKGAEFFTPIRYNNMNDVRSNYGSELEGGVLNQISASAKMIFDNGADSVIINQAAAASNSALLASLDQLKSEDVQVIVMPGATDTAVQNALKFHVEEQSSLTQKRERIGFTAPNGLTNTIGTISTQSEGLNSERMVNIAPPGIDVTFKDALSNVDQTIRVSSIYAGAAIAGRLGNSNISSAEPLTRKALLGIVGLDSSKYLESEMDALAGSGTLVLFNKDNAIRPRHQLTTDVSNVDKRELSVVIVKDRIRVFVREALDATFIGTQITGGTSNTIKQTIESLLDSQVGNLIVGKRNVTAIQNSTDPTAIDVSFEIAPIRPLNYINISFTLFV
jgi:hypothetical protein